MGQDIGTARTRDDARRGDSAPLRPRREWKWLRRFGAAALVSFWLTPAASSVAAIGLLEVTWQDTKGTKVPLEPGPLLILAIGIGLLAWIVVAIGRAPLAGPERANYRSYSEIKTRLATLRGRAQVVCQRYATANRRQDGSEVCAVVSSALDDVHAMLGHDGVVWALGRGYIDAWETLHRAEEMLIEVEDEPELLEEYDHDWLRLNGSAIPQKVHLLELAKSAHAFLCKEKSGRDQPKESCVRTVEQARKTLKEVRFNVNSYRDALWSGLVELRNRTLAALLMTHLVGFALLGLAILAPALTSPPPSPAQRNNWITAGVVYFLVGALVGVFNRLYEQSRADTAVDDYGLAMARLLTVPALSGLAAVGGVMLSSFSSATGTAPTRLSELFNFDHPLVFVVAATFGFAPGLLAARLNQRAQEYQQGIKSTEPTDGATDSATPGATATT